MGVKGAAIATAIACGVGGLMSLVYFIWFSSSLKLYRLKMSVTSLLLTLRNLCAMAKIGFATFLTEIAMSITILIGNYQFMGMLHEDGVAAFAIICYLFPSSSPSTMPWCNQPNLSSATIMERSWTCECHKLCVCPC